MIKQWFFIIFCFFLLSTQAQKKPLLSLKGSNDGLVVNNRLGNSKLDSLYNKGEVTVELSEKTKYQDYKIISFKKDTTFVDTTLVLKKDYKFNFIRKDEFELLPFHNQGQTYNNLGYTYDDVSLYPTIGAKAKHFNYYEVADINYYHLPTPITELMYRAGLEQGQVLDALIAFNISKRHNISMEYKGLRSLGKYRNALSSHGALRLTYSYQSKNNRYKVRSHIAQHALLNQENGGLNEKAIIDFNTGNENFNDRGRLETNFVDAESALRGNRYYLDHEYQLFQKKDSLTKAKQGFKIGHIFTYETKHFRYGQKVDNSLFGDAYLSRIYDNNSLKTTYNQLSTSLYSDGLLGSLKVFIDNYNYRYHYNNVVVLANNNLVSQSLRGNLSAFGANWKTSYRELNLSVKAATTFLGDLKGNYFKAIASYKKDSLFTAKASLLQNSKAPNFNYLLYQSDYKAYNWQNTNFKNEHTRSFLFEFESNKWVNASAQIIQLDNYTYLNTNLLGNQMAPVQYGKTINYVKVKASKELKYKKFALDNTLMFQTVANGEEVFNVPNFVTRNTLYFSDHLFKKKPLFLQTGITVKYFSKYYANAYHPLLGEFAVQNEVRIGNYPVIDIFANARVRQTRIYLKAEHFNELFMQNKLYSSPNYPYRDFVIRFGLVWNFFI